MFTPWGRATNRPRTRNLWRGGIASLAAAAMLCTTAVSGYAAADEPLAPSAEETETPSTDPTTDPADPADPATESTDPAPETENPDGPKSTDQPSGTDGRRSDSAPNSDVVAQAAPLQCNTVHALQGAGTRNVWSVDTATGGLTSVGSFAISGNDGENLNGLGVSADGQKVYGVIPDASGSGRTIYLHDRASGATTSLGAGVASAVTTHGAVNPVNGFYYYGGLTSGVLNIYGFDTTTGTSIGRVASGSIPNGGGNGDWAFDGQGRLYVVAGAALDNRISVINQAIPTTPQETPLTITGTQIARSTVNAAINGIAFGGDGYLYIASSARIYKLNPSSGGSVSDVALSPTSSSVDLASCAVPSTIEVVKDFPEGRSVSSHQATLSVSGGGLTAAVTATTTGTDVGLQDDPVETAGPVLGLNGNTYTVSESGTGASSVLYVSSWECENTATGTVLASGNGITGTVTLPAGTTAVPVLCTFTNTHKFADYGDAPGSYGTTTAQAGPVHKLPGYNSNTNTATHMLGVRVDSENDGASGPNADGDDTAGVDDEDGVFFNTDVSVPGRLETVFVRVSAAGFLNGWIDFNRDGDFDAGSERIFNDRPVPAGLNPLTYLVPEEPEFVGGVTAARFRLSAAAGQATSPTGPAPNGEVEDYTRTLYDAEAAALAECPRGSFPTPVGIIQNQSFETRTEPFVNSGSPNTINFAEHWFDKHTTGGQYFYFGPDFDSGPGLSADFPWRAGADGYGFLGGHTLNGNIGEGATNTLSEPLVPGATYVGFFSIGAGQNDRWNSGYMKMYGVNDPNIGSINQSGVIAHSPTNSEFLFDTPVVSPPPTGSRPEWKLSTFKLRPSQAWPYFRVEARNSNPANPPTTSGHAWINFDDFHLYLCDPIRDFGDAPSSYGTELSNSAAFHEVPDFDDDNAEAPLMLGSSLDVEEDGLPSADADGDDTDGTDDEDAIGEVDLAPGSTNPSVTVSLTNTTGGPATLHGWIDADLDGAFQPDERASASVPAGTSSADLQWSGLPALQVGMEPYLRLRLTTDDLTDDPATAVDERSRGLASDGEVEDHRVLVAHTNDFGDAPDSYGTLSGSTGPAHAATGPRLGSERDAEANGAPGAAADGDDTDGVDDEDALSGPLSLTAGDAPTVEVSVENASDQPATLAGWIDLDRDGVFEPGERATASVPADAGSVTRQLTFSAPTVAGATYLRLRIFAGAVADPQPTGVASAGEVEDHPATIAPGGPVVTCATDPAIFNTAYDGSGGEIAPGSRDLNWEAGLGDATGPASVTDWIPAWATGRATGWALSRFGNADWISYYSSTQHSGNVDVYFRYRFQIAPEVSLDAFSMPMNFYADNSVPEVWVNGVAQSTFHAGKLPQSSNTYQYVGYSEGNRAKIVLSQSFQHGPNTVVVRVGSGQPNMGFMAQVGPSPLCADAGDAPASYGTTKADNGAAHGLPGYDDDAHTADLMLGDTVDADVDGQPSTAADGDDTAVADDEDGLAEAPTFEAGSTTASLDVDVTGATGSGATLHGWIDADLDGVFEPSEHASTAVSAGVTSAALNWTGLSAMSTGAAPYVRLRVTSATLNDTTGTSFDDRARGAAPDGEVEDYRAVVGSTIPAGCASPFVEDFGTGPNYGGPLPAGQTTYVWRSGGTVNDGSYTLVSALAPASAGGGGIGGWWHTGADRTAGDTDGRMMLVNATAGQTDQFFQRTFRGLQPGATYDFSAWVTNAGTAGSIQPNVKFRVVDAWTGAVITEADSGNLPYTTAAQGMVWKRVALQFDTSARAVRLEIQNNAPGGSGNDLALDDISFNLACEFGDAPASYGTLASDSGPVHELTGPRLGATRDGEGDGLPSTGADGDDTAGMDDEDGVAFNPDLGYPNPTIRTGPDPITLEPVSNTLEVTASDDGFASVWVDWNIDGDFNDAGERVANAQPVTAGVNGITFSQAENPPDIRTYVRVRYSTDAASIALPTGPAPDGEVEDYRVLAERLITPAACSPVSEPYYAMTFLSIQELTAGAGTLNSARYPNVAVVEGRPVDMLIQRTGGNNLSSPGFRQAGDDAAWNLNAGGAMAQITYTFVEAGTTTPIAMNGIWTVNDMDRGEVAQIEKAAVAGYAVTPGSQVVISEEPTFIRFSGTVSGNGAPESRWQMWFQNRTTFYGRWDGFAVSGFSLDGDNDIPVPKSCDDHGDAPDSYKTLRASDGPHHTVTPQLRLGADSEFDANGQPGPAADGDDNNRVDDEDGVAEPIELTPGEPTVVKVSVTNDTSTRATLAGWLDLDGDGTFEQSERVVVPIPAGSGADDYNVIFPSGPATTTAYARFRLFPDDVTDPRPTGAATGGEVEDYTVEVLSRELEITKASDATEDARPGDTITYTVTAENTGSGDFTADNPARVVDDLTGVLDDADYNDDATADLGDDPSYTEPRLLWTGALPAGEIVTITYTVTLKGGGDGHVDNVAWAPPIGDPPGPTPDCLTGTVAPPALPLGTELLVNGSFTNGGPNGQAVAPPWSFQGSGAVQWSSPFQQPNGVVGPTIAFHPGDAGGANGTIRQVVDDLQVGGTFRLRGRVGLIASASNGAGSTQQMTADVLDATGAVIATQVVIVPFSTGTTWPAPAGVVDLSFVAPTDEVTVRFTDTSSGPSFSLNVDMLFDDATLVQTELAAETAVPCAAERYDLPKLSIAKSSNRTDLPSDGQQLVYTVTVTNKGPGVYTDDAPATFSDDLSEVLDDADFDAGSITTSGGSASFDPATGTLTWIGALAADASATVTYSVTYDDDKAGDQQLDNSACIPEKEAFGGAQPCITVRVPGSGLDQTKRSDPASGTSVDAGDVITYTLRFTNTGPASATVNAFDNVSGVMDDATLGEVVAEPGLNAAFVLTPGNPVRLHVTGTVPPGETRTVTYTAMVRAAGNRGDDVLRNSLTCPAGSPAGCEPETTEHPVRSLKVTKTSDATVASRPGDTVTYTVTVENDSGGDYTAAEPATLVDDLTGVLDDADYQNDATADVGDDPTYTRPRLRWSGALPAGQTATITYTVVLGPGGDGQVDNVAWSPGPGVPPGPTPDCDAPSTTVPCAEVSYDLPKLSIAKTADPAEANATGDVVTYTVVVKNEGPGDYTAAAPASFDDDLSDVLADAAFVGGSATADVGTAAFAAPTLSWTGVLAAGDSATVSYQVRYTGAGDQSMVNAACVPRVQAADPAEDCDSVTVLGSGLSQSKTSNPPDGAPVDVGDEITYTLTFTNDGNVPATVDTTDDLSGVLDDAELTDGPTAQAGLDVTRTGDVLEITGSVPAGESRTVSYTVRVLPFADQQDHVLANTLACQPGDPQTCEPETTEHEVRRLAITKSSDATADTRQGDTVTYTVTAENIGTGDYTADEPATVVDDLTAVLDDADYNGDASAAIGGTAADDPTYAEPRLTWAGALASGETVTITYTVDLTSGGDGEVLNVAWTPDPGDPPGPTPDCDDPGTTVPCADVEYELPRLSIVKSADRTDLPAVGETMTYTVVVSNEGPGDYTAAEPASFTDDLSDVLDDATYVAGSETADVGTATFTDPELSWSGVLAAGDDATVTYRVRYTGDGDRQLDNSACVPETDALDAATACATVSVPGSGLEQTKTSNPGDGTSVDAGDEITYTLTFSNTGPAAATVDTTDDLSGVLDDAELVEGPTAQSGLTATRNGDEIEIAGSVPAGTSRTVTYTVRVLPLADQADRVLRNALACQPGDPQTCEADVTEHPVRGVEVTKTSDATTDSRPGDTVTYTVTAENTGTGDYTDAEPARVVDDLEAVLDDADYNGDASAAIGGTAADDPTYAQPRVTWTGALPAGDTVTITYTVTLTGGGDGVVRNVAWAPSPGTPPGPTPDCDATTVPCDDERFELPRLSIVKTADPVAVTATGDVVTYTVVVTNEGPGDYTATAPASFEDDLSDVLDDATYVIGSETADVGTPSFTEPALSWTGALAAGDDVTVTYQVRYSGDGDQRMVNAACVPTDEALDPLGACDEVTVDGAKLTHEKSVDPASGTSVEVGQVLTYTLTFANTGRAAATVDTTDDLAGVLDDAELVAGSIRAGAGLSAQLDGQSLAITGTVPAGKTRTVTYRVRVLPFADQGDHQLSNLLACEPGEPAGCAPETTRNPVRHLKVTKVSRPAAVDTGDRVTYVVKIRNDGDGDYTAADPASVVDDLSDVIDDALFDVDDVAVTRGSVDYDAPELTWTGALPAGETVTITYAVTVTNQGDHDLVNTVSDIRCGRGDAGCAPPPTQTLLPHVVPAKSADPASGAALGAGDLVTYTLRWTNDGRADGVVDATDDLSGVLDDADLVAGPTSSSPAVDATVSGDELRVVGPIAAGGTVTVTYQVRVRADGERSDDLLENVLTPDTPQVDCVDDDCEPVEPPGTSHPIGALDDWKTADPADGRKVQTGDRITYTLHFTNTGAASVDVDRDDALRRVLDDAVLVSAPRASDPALAVSKVVKGRFSVTGVLAPDQTVTVSYTVRVKPRAQQGDRNLANFLVDAGQQPPRSCRVAGSRAAPAGRSDCTVHQVRKYDLAVTKRLLSQPKVDVGATVKYGIVVANKGPDTATGRIKLVDRVPRALDLRSVHGKGWNCWVRDDANTAVCVRSKALAPGRSAPRVIVVATARPAAAGSRVVNTAQVKSLGDANVSNNDDPAVLSVAEIPPLPGTGFRQVLPSRPAG